MAPGEAAGVGQRSVTRQVRAESPPSQLSSLTSLPFMQSEKRRVCVEILVLNSKLQLREGMCDTRYSTVS